MDGLGNEWLGKAVVDRLSVYGRGLEGTGSFGMESWGKVVFGSELYGMAVSEWVRSLGRGAVWLG